MTENDTTKSKMLTALSNGDPWIKLATIGLILITGGTNFMETKSGNDFNAKEIERAIEEIHHLYPRLNEAIDRQKDIQKQLNEINQRIK